MKIAILLGSPAISGGSYVIYEHATRIKRRGSSVAIITERRVDPCEYSWHTHAGELEWLTFDQASPMSFDIAVATWWRTVYELWRVRARSYAYFVQSIESRFFPSDETALPDQRACSRLAEATYLFPLNIITEASWIKDYLSSEYEHNVELVKNGIRKDIYNESGEAYAPRMEGKLRVLVEGPVDVPFKNVPRTIELCRTSKADEIWLLTLSEVAHYPGVDRVFSRVPIEETARIYRSCDVIVKLSYIEGMFGPPLEMFHCGGTAIIYNVTGHDEYIKHDENALVAKTDDEDAVVKYLNRLKSEPDFLERLKAGARETAHKWYDWEDASVYFEKALAMCIKSPSGPKPLLEKLSRCFMEYYKNQLKRYELEAIARELAGELDKLRSEVNRKNHEINSVYLSKQWKLATAFKKARRSFRELVKLPFKIIRHIS